MVLRLETLVVRERESERGGWLCETEFRASAPGAVRAPLPQAMGSARGQRLCAATNKRDQRADKLRRHQTETATADCSRKVSLSGCTVEQAGKQQARETHSLAVGQCLHVYMCRYDTSSFFLLLSMNWSRAFERSSRVSLRLTLSSWPNTLRACTILHRMKSVSMSRAW
jgi:hypothetical protein